MKTLALIAALMGTSVAAQQGNDFRVCASVEDTMEILADDYGQSIQMILRNEMEPNAGGATVLFANTETGTWTMIVLSPTHPGLACAIQGGDGFSHDLIKEVGPVQNDEET